MGSRNYKDLHIWQQSMELCEEVYRISLELPESEKYGIANQIQRCSVSVVSNIAEGANRGSSKDFTKFLYIAKASLAELETQLLLIVRIYGPIDIDQTYKKISRINQMFYKLIRSLNEKT